MYQRNGSELNMSGAELLGCTIEQMRGWVESGITVFGCNDGDPTEEHFQHTRSLLQEVKKLPISKPVDAYMLNAKLDLLLDDEENGIARFEESDRLGSPSPAPTATPPTEEESERFNLKYMLASLTSIHEMGGVPFIPPHRKAKMDFERGNWPTRLVLSDSEKRWRAFRAHQKDVRNNRKVWRSFLQAAKRVVKEQGVDYELRLSYEQSNQDETSDWQEWFCWTYLSHDETLKLWEEDEYRDALPSLPWFGDEYCLPRQSAEFELKWHIPWIKEQELLSRTKQGDQTLVHADEIKPTSRKRKLDHEDSRPLKKTTLQVNHIDDLQSSELPADNSATLIADASPRRRSQRLIDRAAANSTSVATTTRNVSTRKLAKPRSRVRKSHRGT